MILDDTAELLDSDGRTAGTVRCAFMAKDSTVMVSSTTGAAHPVSAMSISVELPLSDADTGVPLDMDEDTVTGFMYRGRRWSVTGWPVVARRHGEDHHARWTVERYAAP